MNLMAVFALALIFGIAPQAYSGTDCPADDRIHNLRYVGATWTSPRRVTYAWDVPHGPSPLTVYEVLVSSRSGYCAPASELKVFDETPETQYTLELSQPERVYSVEVRVKGCPSIRSETRFVDDSFTSPPDPPRISQTWAGANEARVTLSEPDTRALYVGLERARKGGGFVEVAKRARADACDRSEEVVADEDLPPDTYVYRAFATNQGTLQRVYSEPVEVAVGGVPAPRVSGLWASPTLVSPGEPVTLRWETEGGTKASLSGVGEVLVQGTATVRPAETTTYTLSVAGPGGHAESSIRVTVVGAERPDLVVPTVVSAPGRAGAYYRTAVQLTNPGSEVALGRLVYRESGHTGSASDPTVTFRLEAGETMAIGSLLEALRVQGNGSLDVYRDQGPLPLVTARITNETPGGGTNGLSLQALSPGEALAEGESGVLQAPSSPELYRFSIGARALHEGATLRLMLLRGDGRPAAEVSRDLPPGVGFQESAEQLFGNAILGNDSVRVTIASGSAFAFGTTADNRTNDPQIQVARAAR